MLDCFFLFFFRNEVALFSKSDYSSLSLRYRMSMPIQLWPGELAAQLSISVVMVVVCLWVWPCPEWRPHSPQCWPLLWHCVQDTLQISRWKFGIYPWIMNLGAAVWPHAHKPKWMFVCCWFTWTVLSIWSLLRLCVWSDSLIVMWHPPPHGFSVAPALI